LELRIDYFETFSPINNRNNYGYGWQRNAEFINTAAVPLLLISASRFDPEVKRRIRPVAVMQLYPDLL